MTHTDSQRHSDAAWDQLRASRKELLLKTELASVQAATEIEALQRRLDEGAAASAAVEKRLADVVEHDHAARAAQAAVDEKRLAAVETQSRTVAEAIIALTEATQAASAAAVLALKGQTAKLPLSVMPLQMA